MPVYEISDVAGGVLFDYTNENEEARDIPYASLTAPSVVKLTVTVNGEPVDIIWAGAGESHSWWAATGGGLLDVPLEPGDRLTITSSGPAAVRLMWIKRARRDAA